MPETISIAKLVYTTDADAIESFVNDTRSRLQDLEVDMSAFTDALTSYDEKMDSMIAALNSLLTAVNLLNTNITTVQTKLDSLWSDALCQKSNGE